MYVNDVSNIAANIRWFMQFYQFRSDPYRFYYLILGTGVEAAEQFRHSADQKYLLRQIKAVDTVLTGATIAGAASVNQMEGLQPLVPKTQSAVLLTLYGHRLAAGGSFAPAQSIPIITLMRLLYACTGIGTT
jgi:general transcription factor 3C polypeptide 3 (transcription factor C subunit 4)